MLWKPLRFAWSLLALFSMTPGAFARDGGKERLCTPGHESPVGAVTFSLSGDMLATVGRDRAVLVWDAATGKQIRRFDQQRGTLSREHPDPYLDPALWSAFSADGSQVAASYSGDAIRFWDIPSGKGVRTLSWKGSAVVGCMLTTDGKRLVVRTPTAATEDALRLCDAQSGKEIRTFSNKNSDDSDAEWIPVDGRLALAPDNRRVAATDCGRIIRIWSIESGNVFRSFTVEKCNVLSIAYSPDGRYLIAGTGARMANGSNGPPPPLANTVRIWDIESGRQVLLLRNRSRASVLSVAFSSDGRMFASASADGAIRIWEFTSGKEIVHRDEQSKEPLCLAFSPDCSTMAAGMDDGSILLWDFGAAAVQPLRRNATPEEAIKQWTDLASNEAPQAYRSICSLIATPQNAINFLRERLHCISAHKLEGIDHLISNLDNDDFDRREAASKQLAAFGAQAEPALRKALAETQSAEVRSRINQLLKTIDNWVVTDPDTLRSLRAIWVLERIGTPEARAVLEDLAKGAPEARQTQEAKAALDWLDKRAAAKP